MAGSRTGSDAVCSRRCRCGEEALSGLQPPTAGPTAAAAGEEVPAPLGTREFATHLGGSPKSNSSDGRGQPRAVLGAAARRAAACERCGGVESVDPPALSHRGQLDGTTAAPRRVSPPAFVAPCDRRK
eukprot:366216-Chlamydomonas_euryale.AAC.5